MLKSLIFLSFVSFIASAQTKTEWIDFKSEKFGFTISIPREPSVTTKEINTETGPMTMNIIFHQPSPADHDVNTFYGVNIADYQPGTFDHSNKDHLNEFFENAIEGSVKAANGELVYEEIINVQGFPGRDYRVLIRNGEVTLRSKTIVVHDRVYNVTTMTNKKDDFNTSISRFMNSFQLIKK